MLLLYAIRRAEVTELANSSRLSAPRLRPPLTARYLQTALSRKSERGKSCVKVIFDRARVWLAAQLSGENRRPGLQAARHPPSTCARVREWCETLMNLNELRHHLQPTQESVVQYAQVEEHALGLPRACSSTHSCDGWISIVSQTPTDQTGTMQTARRPTPNTDHQDQHVGLLCRATSESAPGKSSYP
jgi:hypothetical protein